EDAPGTSPYSEDSPWWQANRVKMLCSLNYRALAPKVREVFDPIESDEMEENRRVEVEVRKLLQAGKETEATARLQAFVNANCERIGKEYATLNSSLPSQLETS